MPKLVQLQPHTAWELGILTKFQNLSLSFHLQMQIPMQLHLTQPNCDDCLLLFQSLIEGIQKHNDIDGL